MKAENSLLLPNGSLSNVLPADYPLANSIGPLSSGSARAANHRNASAVVALTESIQSHMTASTTICPNLVTASGDSSQVPVTGTISVPCSMSSASIPSAAVAAAAAAAAAASSPISFYLNGSASSAYPPLFAATRLAPSIAAPVLGSNVNGISPTVATLNGLNTINLNRLSALNGLNALNGLARLPAPANVLTSSLASPLQAAVGTLPGPIDASLDPATSPGSNSNSSAAVAAAAAAAAAVSGTAGGCPPPTVVPVTNLSASPSQVAAAAAVAQARLLRLRLAGSDEQFAIEMNEISEFVDRLKLTSSLNTDEKILNAALCILFTGTSLALLSPADIVDDIYAGKHRIFVIRSLRRFPCFCARIFKCVR